MGKRKPRIVDYVSDSDDEEIPEDEAFNSDDERKYGSFFERDADDESVDAGSDNDRSEDDEDSEGSEDESDDDEDSKDGDGGQYMLDLLNKLDDGKEEEEEQKPKSIAPHVKESEFSSSVIKKAGLTLDNLMDGLEDTKGFGVVQKTLKKVSQGQATAAPVAKVVSDRAQRKVHYEIQTKEVSQWSHAIHQNRKAETLDFRPKQRQEVTRDVLIDKFVPTTDFEKALHAALQEAGQEDEEAMLKAEEDALHDDLGTNEISMDEFKKRRGQLAKMRALMFYHEQKRHHINKIKSKKYRRIRKKQRERLKEADLEAQVEENPDLARELEEKEEIERMKERASLAHKNTSKWAKRILKRGKNVDVDTRRALSAQLKRGDDLLKRMNSTQAGEEDSEDEDLVETARKVLADTEDDNDEPIQGKGLFKLTFMQRGVERQREKAKQEARQLLMELEANEEYDNEESDDGNDDDEVQEKSTKKKAKTASKEEMKQVLSDGDMVASSLKFGAANSVAVTGSINIDAGFDDQSSKDVKTANVSEHRATLSYEASTFASGTQSTAKLPSNTTQKKKHVVSKPTVMAPEEAVNPWLANDSPMDAMSDQRTTKVSKEVKKRDMSGGKKGFVDVDRAVDLLDSTPAPPKDKTIATPKAAPDQKIITLTQEELVRKAFAAPSDKDVEEEFAKEKAIVEEREDPTRKQKKEKDMASSSGWGSWAGEGAPPPKPPRKFPKKLQPPEEKKRKRKRTDEKKPNVILSQKRIKKTADKFMLAQIPYPFTSREDYERSMTGGVGREWNVTSSFQDMTRPEVYTRAGKVIQPISKKAKQKRAAAKF